MQNSYDDQPFEVHGGSPNRYKAIDGFEFPTEQVDSPTALTLLMAKDLLHHSLPSVCHKQLNNHLGDIEDRLKKSSKSEYLNWKAKVALYPEGYSNRMGNIETIDNEIFVKITEALFSDKKIKALYVNREDEESEREMAPLGLVNRGNIIYLLVTFWKGSQVVPLPLSRFISLDILDKPLLKPDNFSLHDLLKNGGIFNVHKGEIEEIQLSISDFLLVHFKERPPGSDFQILSIVDNNKNIVSFNEVISDEFIWWLRAMGPNVKVLQPESLIDTLKKDLEKTLSLY
jgi:predicted DNA-binding transcriptional regulator YafY